MPGAIPLKRGTSRASKYGPLRSATRKSGITIIRHEDTFRLYNNSLWD